MVPVYHCIRSEIAPPTLSVTRRGQGGGRGSDGIQSRKPFLRAVDDLGINHSCIDAESRKSMVAKESAIVMTRCRFRKTSPCHCEQQATLKMLELSQGVVI